MEVLVTLGKRRLLGAALVIAVLLIVLVITVLDTPPSDEGAARHAFGYE